MGGSRKHRSSLIVGRAVVFLDRDGVLNDPVHDPYDGRPEAPLRAADVVLARGAIEGVRALNEAGIPLVVVSNQPGAAKGKVTSGELRGVHERVRSLLAAEGADIADWRYCFHHPDASDPQLRGACECRKPAPGMLLDAAADHDIDLSRSWIVGDTDSDVGAGRAAGVGTVLIGHPGSRHRRTDEWIADAQADDLQEAAAFLLLDGELRSPGHA
ncbi:MAG TPA: HAD family hydrolase [Baekduia sp.]|nr:HAD family hydrolase [Baekduia sp.]